MTDLLTIENDELYDMFKITPSIEIRIREEGREVTVREEFPEDEAMTTSALVEVFEAAMSAAGFIVQ